VFVKGECERAYFIKTFTFSLRSQLNHHQIVTVSLFLILWIALIMIVTRNLAYL